MENQENQNNDVFVVNGVANYSFVKNNVDNVKTLSSLLGLIYKTGWYYKQWKEIKKYNESYRNISPFWRGIFYIGYAGKLKKIVNSLYEAKLNSVLQNDAVPQEEKEAWQKEYKKFNGIFANFSLIQQAINKIVPLGHPENKTTWGSFLGLIPLAIILMIIFGVNIISFLFNGCYQTEGNILKNTCDDYSLTFPTNKEIWASRSEYLDFFCQGDEDKNICMSPIMFPNHKDFNFEALEKEQEYPITDKFTKQYAGNTVHCFKQTVPDRPFFNVCYMEVQRKEPIYFIFFNNTDNGEMESLEKLMNSYKNL